MVIKDACDLKGLSPSLHSGRCLRGPDVPHGPGDRQGCPACRRGTVLWPELQSSHGAGERRRRGTERHSLGRLCQPLRAGWAQVCRALSQALAFYQMAWGAQGGRQDVGAPWPSVVGESCVPTRGPCCRAQENPSPLVWRHNSYLHPADSKASPLAIEKSSPGHVHKARSCWCCCAAELVAAGWAVGL